MEPKRIITTLFVVLLMAAGMVHGATTGQITGVITDTETKEPLAGVSVSVVGTNLGDVTDNNGQYTVINVPVGTYTLRISAVGYATLEVADVRVSADLANFQNQELSSKAADLGTTIKVTAEQPLIVKDKVTTINIVDEEKILALPTRGFDQVVGIQSGVVQFRPNPGVRQRGDRESTNSPELNIRGGRPSEVAYYVDGFSQQDPLSGNSTANISNNAIKEVSIISGGFPAEYGHVSSGIVNTITKSGNEDYHGTAEVVTDNVTSDGYDNNFYSLELSGPIPGLDRGYFFGSAERRYFGDRNPSATARSVLPGAPDLLPNNSLSGWSYQGKVDYAFSPNLKLQVSANGSRDQWREYLHQYLFNSAHIPYYDDKNFGANVKITHTLNSNAFYNLSGSYFITERFRGDGVHREDLFDYSRTLNPSFDDFALFWEEGHVYDDYLKRKSSYVGFKGDLNVQANASNTVKAGFEFQRHTLRYYRHLTPVNLTMADSNATELGGGFTNVDRYGYDIQGNESDNIDGNELKHPMNFALYAQDRLEYRGLIVNAGLRLDLFDYNTDRLKDPTDPFNPSGADPNVDPLANQLDDSDWEDSKSFTRLSPRVGIAFPISDRTQMYTNYGKFYQRPDLVRLYVGHDFLERMIAVAPYFYPIGNPNLEPEQTTSYEVGLNHQVGDNTALSVALFFKDVKDLVQLVNQPAQPNSFAVFQNGDYGTIKGIEFNLQMRRTRNIELDLKYTLQYASGLGSYANTQSNIAWTNENAPKLTAPLTFDQRHKLTGIFDYRLGREQGPKWGETYPLENFGLNVIVAAASGTPYTPQDVYNEVTLASTSPTPSGPRNSEYGPWTFQIDLKAERRIDLGSVSLSPYIWVKNLLDTKNAFQVYESTGKPDNTNWLKTPEGETFIADNSTADATGLNGEQKYRIKEQNPQNYGVPRQLLFGLRVSF